MSSALPSSLSSSSPSTTILNKTITGAGMFFVGCGIGLAMNLFFKSISERYERDHLVQMLISVTQLIMISFIIYTFQEQVHTMGLFVSGILMAQEIFIMKMVPSRKKTKTNVKVENEEDEGVY